MNNRWFNLSFPFPNEYLCFSALRIIATGIWSIAINKCDRESPWNIRRLILTFPNLFFPENKTVLQLCILLLSSSLMLLAVPISPRVFSVQMRETMLYVFRKSIYATFRFVFLPLLFPRTALSIKTWSSVPLLFRRQSFCSYSRRFCWLKGSQFFSLVISASNSQRRFKQAIGLVIVNRISLSCNFLYKNCPTFCHLIGNIPCFDTIIKMFYCYLMKRSKFLEAESM